MHAPARAMHERVKFWIQTSKITPDLWLSANFCPIKKNHSTLLGTGTSSTCRFVVHKDSQQHTPLYSYTVHSLARDCCWGTKVISLGDKLLHIQHITYNNILCLGGLYASLFCTAFLSLKGQFHKICYPYCFAYNILYGSNMDMLIQLC